MIHCLRTYEQAGASVTFNNKFSEPISLFWQGDNDVVKIGDIEAFSQIDVSTFYGHTFFATYQGRTEKIQTNKVIMRSKSSYTFEPTEKKLTKNPHVKLLNSQTTAMSAKFRCFVPSTVHIWYDNGLGKYAYVCMYVYMYVCMYVCINQLEHGHV